MAARRERGLRDEFLDAVGDFPLERDRNGLLLLFLEELQLHGIKPPRYQRDRLAMGLLIARADPRVDQRTIGIVDPEPRAIGGLDVELVFAGLGGEEGAG